MKTRHTKHFQRAYRKLPREVQREAEKQEKLFRRNPRDPKLKTHKLKGSLAGLWSFSVTYQYRILFEFVDEKTALFYDIGTHDVYR